MRNTPPRISIIVPFYNVEKYIGRCIESVANQTFKDIEALFIDDCGEDGTRDILEQFIEAYDGDIEFHIITLEYNQGQSVARNRGIMEAKGDYIYFLDSDDYISENCIELLYNEFQKDASIQMAIGNYKIIGPLHLAPFSLQERIYTSDEIIKEQLSYNIYTMPWNKLIRKNFIIENNLFFQSGIVHEDNLWSLCSALCFDRIAVVLETTYYYIIRQGSTVCSHTPEWHQQQLFEVLKYFIRFVFESNAPLKKMVTNRLDVFQFIQRDMETFIMTPYKQGNRELAYQRYQEIRNLPHWDEHAIKSIPGLSFFKRLKYKHFFKPIEKGFNNYTQKHKKFRPQPDNNVLPANNTE